MYTYMHIHADCTIVTKLPLSIKNKTRICQPRSNNQHHDNRRQLLVSLNMEPVQVAVAGTKYHEYSMAIAREPKQTVIVI